MITPSNNASPSSDNAMGHQRRRFSQPTHLDELALLTGSPRPTLHPSVGLLSNGDYRWPFSAISPAASASYCGMLASSVSGEQEHENIIDPSGAELRRFPSRTQIMQCDVDQSHHASLPSQPKCNLNPYILTICTSIMLPSETVQTEARAPRSCIATSQ